MARQQLRRYIWLIDTIRSAGTRGITYEDVNKRWKHSSLNDYGDELPWRTFQDHKKAILEEFDIEITCDRRDNTYRIAEEYNEYGSVKSTLIDALVLNNSIRESPDLNGCIVFNDNFHQQCLPELVRAIRDHQVIRFRYFHSYEDFRAKQKEQGVPTDKLVQDIDNRVDIETYGLYFCTAWFMVGRSVRYGSMQIYALHKMSEIEFLDAHYAVPADFNVGLYMSNFNYQDVMFDPPRESDDGNAFDTLKMSLKYDFKY